LPSLRRFSARELIALLGEHGFARVRQRGSHIVLQRREANTTITVVVPNHDEIRVGTLLSIIRQSGLARGLFEA
jgi:predicted RNA binding protein YcfA (HicA-like mRNA interferase family)